MPAASITAAAAARTARNGFTAMVECDTTADNAQVIEEASPNRAGQWYPTNHLSCKDACAPGRIRTCGLLLRRLIRPVGRRLSASMDAVAGCTKSGHDLGC